MENNKLFKASEIPDYRELAQMGMNNHVELYKPTIPKEFKFNTDERVNHYRSRLSV